MSPVDKSRAVLMTSPADFDAWLREHGALEREVVVAMYKKSSGRQTVTVSQLVEVALCHGWIDSLGGRIDDDLTALRFTPRRPRSNWSPTNRATVKRLLAEGRMTPAGIAVLPPDL